MLAERAHGMGAKVELHVITPEASPLALFGAEASRQVATMLTDAGITFHGAAAPEIVGVGEVRPGPGQAPIAVDRIISMPRLEGPAIPGLPHDQGGFLVTDRHARVQGVPDVYAAGDVTAFPIKQGGLACQQADAAAAAIAAHAGAAVSPEPFTPVLRGMLRTERGAHFMRREGEDERVAGRALWWPPTKIAGRELAGYLETLDEAAGRRTGLAVSVEVGASDTHEIEVLSLH